MGGHAVAFHGHPRYTGDIDLWVRPSAENAGRLLAVLEDFGFGDAGLEAKDFTEPGRVVQLGRPPNRIDLLTGGAGSWWRWHRRSLGPERAPISASPSACAGRAGAGKTGA